MKRMSKRVKQCLVTVGILVVIDMLIKLVIDSFFMGVEIAIGDLFGFKPYLNTTQLSIFNNELGLSVSTGILIVLNIVLIPVIPLSFRWVNKDNEFGDTLNVSEDFLLAGTVCSLLDKLIWGGSLDYIYFLGRWIIDLKDIYLLIAIVAFFYCGVRYGIRKRG